MKKKLSPAVGRFLAGAVVLTLAVGVGCRPTSQQEEAPAEQSESPSVRDRMDPEVLAQLDSGTQAFREKDYDGALSHYEKVTELDGHNAAGWYGVYMARKALGDSAAAEDALRRSRALAPEVPQAHPAPGDSAGDGAGSSTP